MAKTKPVASGVDLAGLSTAQLEALVIEAKAKAIEQKEKDNKETVKALKESGELGSYKKEFIALGKEGKKLSRKATFDLVLPIRFTIHSEGPYLREEEIHSGIFSLGGYHNLGDNDVTESDLFSHSFEAKLMRNHELYSKLTSDQVSAINSAIADYAENACEEIFNIIPEEIMDHYDNYAKKVTTFIKKMEAVGLTPEDLV